MNGAESLAVKYRPDSWDAVIGQDSVVKSIRSVLSEGVSKAFLLTGGSGCGKTTIGRLIAKELGAEGDGIVEIDGATYTGIDDMRTVIDSLRFRPMSGSQVKVVILDEVHMISRNAANSVLKSIEEPPPHVYWVLCTTNPEKVLTTIKTRCATYALKDVGEEEIFALLEYVVEEEGYETPSEVIDLIAKECGGSPRQALAYLSVCAKCETRKEAASVLSSATESSEVIDLCRFLINPQGRNWNNAVKLIKGLEGMDPEGVRIQIMNYLGKCILGAKSEKSALRLLAIADEFNTPYRSSEKITPLLLSVGAVVFGD